MDDTKVLITLGFTEAEAACLMAGICGLLVSAHDVGNEPAKKFIVRLGDRIDTATQEALKA